MRICWCVLAGTDACKHCRNYYNSTNDWYEEINFSKLIVDTHKWLVDRKYSWEIPSFMNKGDEYDRKS